MLALSPVPVIPTKIIPSVQRSDQGQRSVATEFTRLLDSGAKLRISGSGKSNPDLLFARGLKPKHKIELFDTTFYLTNVRQIPELRFFVAYVVQLEKGKPSVYPRIFYKDLSLCWRSASHFAMDRDGDIWVGKGDVRDVIEDGEEMVESQEATTDLPLEMQTAVESLVAYARKPRGSVEILELVLKKSNRVEPFRDFTDPREKAQSNPKNLINRGNSIASFSRQNDPASLRIAKGFQPDFKNGIVERSHFKSRIYGGKLIRCRVLSQNQLVQYLFFAGPHHVWIIPPQATTTELSSYGVRTIDVVADDDLFIPGYEYHHWEETPNGPELYSQIPAGFVGETCPYDEAKADASPWLNKIPVIKRFRKEVLKRNSRR